MPAYHGRPSSRIPTIKSPGCTVSTWQTLRGTRRLWVELCSHSIEAIILSTVHSKDAIQKLTISILPLPKMNKESVGSAIHDIRASPTTIAANQCGSQQRYECWWHNTGTRVLEYYHNTFRCTSCAAMLALCRTVQARCEPPNLVSDLIWNGVCMLRYRSCPPNQPIKYRRARPQFPADTRTLRCIKSKYI